MHVIRAGKQPVVGIELVFRRGGIKHEHQNASCFFAIKMLGEGTRRRSAFQVSSFVDGLGAYLQLAPGLDRSSVEVYSLRKHTGATAGTLEGNSDRICFSGSRAGQAQSNTAATHSGE